MLLRLASATVLVLSLLGVHSLSYDPDDYLEVYPDPRDPEVLKGRTPLHFALIQSLGGPLSQFDSSGTVAGVKVALDWINNDSSLLPGYTLHYTFTDSKCNRTEGLNALYSQLFHQPTKLAIIGSGCSVTTEPTAEISRYYNLTQISCASSSSALRNRVRYPRYFQLLSAEDRIALGFFGVIREYSWRKIALLVQNENVFTVTMERLKSLLDSAGKVYSERLFDTDVGISKLGSNPFDQDGSRIFVIAMYSVNARPLLCKAYDLNIQLPNYLLLTYGWYTQFWWRIQTPDLSCTVEQRETVLHSSLACIDSTFLNETSDMNVTTSVGITGGEFLREEQQYVGAPPLNITYFEYSQYCHDATWSLALALNNTFNSLKDKSVNDEISQAANVTPPFRLEDFSYSDHRVLEIIFQYLSNTSFDGVTGSVNFGDQGIRTFTDLTIYQFRNRTNATDGSLYLDWGTIGHILPVNGSSRFAYAPGEDINTVWNGLVPYDGVPRNETVSIHPAVAGIFITLGSCGILFALACLIFNFICRNSKLIKLASYYLNYLIGIGAIVLYVNTFFFVIPTTDRDVVVLFCNLTPWLTAIGYSLCFGTILVKMARVYYIFSNPTAKKKGVKDWVLILSVAALVGIDLTILITYTVVEGLRGNLDVHSVYNGQSLEGILNVQTDFYVYICDSTARSIFLGVLYGYKMVLQGIALLLAFSIRKVKVKGLNDAKYIAAAIYVSSIVLAVIIVATYSLTTIIDGFAALFCTGFLVGTTFILVLVFIPLMVGLYKDPTGEMIFKTATVDVSSMRRLSSDNDSASTIATLRKRIKQLETEVDVQRKQEKMEKITEEEPLKARPSSIKKNLEFSNMVFDEVPEGKAFSKTIWDPPEGDVKDQENQRTDI